MRNQTLEGLEALRVHFDVRIEVRRRNQGYCLFLVSHMRYNTLAGPGRSL